MAPIKRAPSNTGKRPAAQAKPAMAAKKIRVLIADNRPVFRLGWRILLERESDVSVVGEAEKGEQVLKKVSVLKPQVIVLQARLGEANGRSVLPQLHRTYSKARLLIMTASDQEEDQVK